MGPLVMVMQFVAALLFSMVAGSVFGIWRGYDPTTYAAATFLEMHQGAVRGLNALLAARLGACFDPSHPCPCLVGPKKGLVLLALPRSLGVDDRRWRGDSFIQSTNKCTGDELDARFTASQLGRAARNLVEMAHSAHRTFGAWHGSAYRSNHHRSTAPRPILGPCAPRKAGRASA
jgi:hypothetical protein